MPRSLCASASAATFVAWAALALPPGSRALAADVAVHPVLSEKLPNVPGKAITLVRGTIPPSASSPSHHHAGAVAVYVIKGSLISQVGEGTPKTYRAGETFFEPPGSRHVVSANPSKTETTELLASFVADGDATLTTYDK